MLRVGLTGGIGSGKTTVAGLFARHGAPAVDTDEIAHRLVAPGQPALAEIVTAFGTEMLDARGALDRARLRRRVFTDPILRRRLEAILHPRIRAEVARQTGNLRVPYSLVVVPLLIEAGFTDLVDRVLVVEADEDTRIQRAQARSDMDEAEIRKIIASQANRQARLQRADDVITNNSDLAHLEREVARLHGVYLTLARTESSR